MTDGMTDAIRVENLGKRFKRYAAHRPMTWMEAAVSRFQGVRSVDQFWALRHISFTVAPGEMLGVIGHNGAGKSTLLQLLGGITRPNEGQIQVNGRIGALLDLGAGFHGDLTGRENVFVSAIVAGLKRQEVARRFDAIVEFAELEAFIDNPVRTYSTGMMMRLAFAIAIHTRPDVLLVDEYLSVGDVSFQAKCLQRIKELKQAGCAIVLISHSVQQIQTLCSHALWLQRGEVMAYGTPKVIAGQYASAMQTQTQQRTPDRPPQLTRSGMELRINKNRFGTLEAEITDVQINPETMINSGDRLCVTIHYCAPQPIIAPHFGISISRSDGEICLDTNTDALKFAIDQISGENSLHLVIDRLDLTGGKYFVNVGLFEQDWHYAYDYHWHVYPIEVAPTMNQKGTIAPPMRWIVQPSSIEVNRDR
jgi:lipopolysaccharide transport system ATP-binding protein